MDTLTARKQISGMTRVDIDDYFDDIEVISLYSWIDRIPLSRPKKNISKDFADGVLVAEVVHHYFPKMVELHNYSPASNTKQRMDNWMNLNRRVLRRLELDLSDDVIRALVNTKPKVIERVLMLLRLQIDKFLERTGRDALWRRRELYYHQPDNAVRLSIKSPPSRPTTPPGLGGIKSPRNGNALSQRSLTPTRQTKSEPAANSPRKYKPNEIPHGHPDRTSYFADKPLQLVSKPFLPPIMDNIPKVLYEEKEMECQAKEETIQILNAKIRRLEQLLHLKDVRIEDLHTTLQHTVGYSYAATRKR